MGGGFSNVAIKDKHLYTMGSDFKNDTVFCLDAETGKEIWKYTFPYVSRDFGPHSTPTIDGDSVYTLSTKGHLYCFNTKTGKLQWHKQLVEEYGVVSPFYGFAGSPVVEKNLLIITGNSYGIALDKSNGKVVWKSPACEGDFVRMDQSGSEYATPVIYTQGGNRYSLIFNTLGLNSVDIVTGKLDWFQQWPSEENPGWANAADPVVFDNKVFISAFGYTSIDVGCALLDIGSGKPKILWQNKNMSNYFSTCVYIDGYLFGYHGNLYPGTGMLKCLDTQSGKVFWEKDLGTLISLFAAGKNLIILGEDGMLYTAEASPHAYTEFSSAQVLELRCWTPPVLCNGKIYCRDQMGNLVCVDMR
jgi:outer membrane protein assembly factor BamB